MNDIGASWLGRLVVLLLTMPAARTTAQVQHHEVRLSYSAQLDSVRCPEPAKLKALTAARLGYDPFRDDALWLARVALVAEDSRLTGTLELSRPGVAPRRRTLSAQRTECESLFSSLALALAIAIDPQPLTPTPSARAPQVEPPSSAPAPKPATEPLPELTVASAPWQVLGWLAGRLVPGHLPGVPAGLSFLIDVRVEWFGVRVAGTWLTASQSALGGVIQGSTLEGELEACGHFDAFKRAHVFAACVHTAVGALDAGGVGFVDARRVTLPSASVGPRLRAQWNPVSSLVLGVWAGGQFSLVRNALMLGTAEVWRTPPVQLDLGLAAGWRFR